MGCGSSVDAYRELTPAEAAEHRTLHPDCTLRSENARTALDEKPKLALFAALDRTLEDAMVESDGSEVDSGEPSSLALSFARAKVIVTARVKHGINGDANQFEPDPVYIDDECLTRVIEWFAIADLDRSSTNLCVPPGTGKAATPRKDQAAAQAQHQHLHDGAHGAHDEPTATNTTFGETSSDSMLPSTRRAGSNNGRPAVNAASTTPPAHPCQPQHGTSPASKYVTPGSGLMAASMVSLHTLPQTSSGRINVVRTSDDDDGPMPPGPFQKMRPLRTDEPTSDDDGHDDEASIHTQQSDDGSSPTRHASASLGRSGAVVVPPVIHCFVGKRVVSVKLIEKMATGLRFPLQECTLNAHNRLIDRAVEEAGAR